MGATPSVRMGAMGAMGATFTFVELWCMGATFLKMGATQGVECRRLHRDRMLLEGGPEMNSAPRTLPRWSPVLCLVLALAVTGVSCQVSETRLEGLWLSDGYGLFAEISPTAVTLFEITAVSCLPSGDEVVATSQEPDGSLRLTFGHGQEATLTPETESTAIFQPIGTASYRTFRRVAARPAVCEEPIQSTPLTNFDVFWTTYKEHYPFFELKGVDWDAVRAEVRPKITDATTPEALFDLLAETIAPLEDVHTSISAEAPDRYFQGFRSDPELPGATSVAEAWPLLSKRFDRALEIIESGYIQGELHSFCQDHLRFGRLAGEFGVRVARPGERLHRPARVRGAARDPRGGA